MPKKSNRTMASERWNSRRMWREAGCSPGCVVEFPAKSLHHYNSYCAEQRADAQKKRPRSEKDRLIAESWQHLSPHYFKQHFILLFSFVNFEITLRYDLCNIFNFIELISAFFHGLFLICHYSRKIFELILLRNWFEPRCNKSLLHNQINRIDLY